MSRCEEAHGSLRCQGEQDHRGVHRGVHWANTHGHQGVRWGLVDHDCLIGIEAGLVCMEKGAHTTHRGHMASRPGGRLVWSDPEPVLGGL